MDSRVRSRVEHQRTYDGMLFLPHLTCLVWSFRENVAYQSQAGSPTSETRIVGGYGIPNLSVRRKTEESRDDLRVF